ncbi:MAG: hypothetical protein ACXWQO_15770 [Bdellovibrionota bacterium]
MFKQIFILGSFLILAGCAHRSSFSEAKLNERTPASSLCASYSDATKVAAASGDTIQSTIADIKKHYPSVKVEVCDLDSGETAVIYNAPRTDSSIYGYGGLMAAVFPADENSQPKPDSVDVNGLFPVMAYAPSTSFPPSFIANLLTRQCAEGGGSLIKQYPGYTIAGGQTGTGLCRVNGSDTPTSGLFPVMAYAPSTSFPPSFIANLLTRQCAQGGGSLIKQYPGYKISGAQTATGICH